MISLEQESVIIARFNYGEITSEVHWFPGHMSSIEFLRLKQGAFLLLRGSKEYCIADVYGTGEEFRERYGWEGQDYHSRLASIGTFSDYLKKQVPSFDLSLFYINSLSSGIVPFDAFQGQDRARELQQELEFKERKLKKLKFDQEAGLTVGREAISLEAEIRELKEELRQFAEKQMVTERLRSEYKDKGTGGVFIIRAHSPSYICKEHQLQQTTSGILDNLQNMNNVVKNQAWEGFRIRIKELERPTLAFSTESLGLFDPRTLEQLINEYGAEELEELKSEVEKLFVHRWGVSARVGERTYEKSAAIAEGIAYLMQRAIPAERASQIPEPDYKKLPTFRRKGRRLVYMGFTLARDFQLTDFPYLYDLDQQGPLHTLIVGSSGSGKTICASNLAEGAVIQGNPVLILDTTNQWTGFLKPCQDKGLLSLYERFRMNVQPTGFKGRIYTPNSNIGLNLTVNLLARPDVKQKDELLEYANETSSVIEALCNLSDREATYLRSIVLEAWEANEHLDYANLIERAEQWGASQGVNITSTKLKLEGLAGYSFLFSGQGLKDISSLWSPGEVTVVALLHLRENQKLFCAYYLTRELLSYFYQQPDTDELKLLLVVEEVHRFIPKYTPDMPREIYLFLERAARELRKKGVGLVFISQVMSDFTPAMRANTATKIWLRNAYDVDVDRASQDMGSEYSKHLSNLKAGQGIINFPEFGQPFFVQFRPPLHHPKTLSDEEIDVEMALLKGMEIGELLLRVPETERVKGAAKELSKVELLELEQKFRALPKSKVEALKSLAPEVHDLVTSLGKILALKPEKKRSRRTGGRRG